jgi:hypothetical protein
MDKIKNKEFKAWLFEEINDAFGLTRLYEHKLWKEFEGLSIPSHHKHYEAIEELRQELLLSVESWNEDELKFMFISPFIKLVSFFSPKYKIFTQRKMSVSYDNGTKITSGNVEFMIAKGIQTPKKPFFFLHEHKQSPLTPQRGNFFGDPVGQLLIAMVAAQVQNADGETLYGCYVFGRSWFFVVLEGKEYAVSKAYDATENTIYQIFAILLWFKQKTEEKFA